MSLVLEQLIPVHGGRYQWPPGQGVVVLDIFEKMYLLRRTSGRKFRVSFRVMQVRAGVFLIARAEDEQ